MNLSDICIYGYLGVLAVCCSIYGGWVIIYGGVNQQPIRVDVALPQNIVLNQTNLSGLNKLANITDGVAVDVWWGLVETNPMEYDWSEYDLLFNNIKSLLPKAKVKVVLNFHACTAGQYMCDTNVSLPPWLTTFGYENSEIFYWDASNFTNSDYLSSGVDHLNLFPNNRTAVEMYVDFVANFAGTFKSYFDTFIYEVQVGLGPGGQLIYPAFNSKWKFPGIGEFQCYDPNLQQEYFTYAQKTKSQFAFLPPPGAVEYTQTPVQSDFFGKPKENGSASDYGQFFTSWYSSRLLQHGAAILGQVTSVLKTFSPNATVAAQIGCVYWQNSDITHAAEVTAGYMNYTIISQMFQAYGVRMVFGCFDVLDREVNKGVLDAHAAPQQLVSEMLQTARTVGLSLEGTNNIQAYDSEALDTIVGNVKHDPTALVGFTYNSFDQEMLYNLPEFDKFVQRLNDPSKK